MDRTVLPFPRSSEPAGGVGLLMLEAARAWRRHPGCGEPFPDSTIRRLAAAGLLGAMAPLDGLMAVITVHAREPVDLGRPGDPVGGPDARLLSWILGAAVLDGEVGEAALDRLALRVAIGSRSLLGAALDRLSRAVRPRVTRGVLPDPLPPAGMAHDHASGPATRWAAE